MKKELIIKIVGYLLIAMMIGTVLFIFINSMLPPEKSTEQSDTIKDIIVEILPDNSKAESFVEEYIRKIAHFTEFTALGMCLAWLHGMLGKGKKQAFFWGVLAASVDETIQRFVPDRGPAVKDVCIDSAGVLTGIILLWFGYNYLKKRSAKLSLDDM